MTTASKPVPGATVIVLARHGRTQLNADGRLRGLADPPLDEVGVREASILAEALLPLHPVEVRCSPLQRTRRTAQEVADRCAAPLHLDTRFGDRDYGPQTGRLRATVVAERGSVDAAPGVEPARDVLQRASAALTDLCDQHPGDALVVVTHDAVIVPLIESLLPQLAPVRIPTGSWSVLERTPTGEWSARGVGLTSTTN